jgi:hypothetical protein
VASLDATELARRGTGSQSSEQLAPSKRDTTTAINVRPLAGEAWLRVENLRVEPAPAQVPEPAALLKFDLSNETVLRLSDVVVRVSFFEETAKDTEATPGRVVVGPLIVRVHETIEAGYVIGFEMLFRNLSSDCDCDPHVEILSARSLPD